MLIVELKGFSFVLQAWLYHFPLLGPAHRNPRRHFQQHSLMAHIPEFTEKTWHFLKASSTYTKQMGPEETDLQKVILLNWTGFTVFLNYFGLILELFFFF